METSLEEMKTMRRQALKDDDIQEYRRIAIE
jgi:hypothetical protein